MKNSELNTISTPTVKSAYAILETFMQALTDHSSSVIEGQHLSLCKFTVSDDDDNNGDYIAKWHEPSKTYHLVDQVITEGALDKHIAFAKL